MRWLLVLVCLLLATKPPYDPTSNYEVRQIEGWKVYVNKRLLRAEGDVASETLKLLETKLYEINRVVPRPALDRLHEVAIWLELEDKQFECGCYHPSRKWLVEHGVNPDKARSVEIANAANFLRFSLDQPSLVLHELAHAYHHRVLGYDNAEILAAYRRAVESKSYESVLRYNGRRERAYAIKNAQEYFAELSEAFFGTNDYYPFVRAEIKEHDPHMYGLLKKLWGK